MINLDTCAMPMKQHLSIPEGAAGIWQLPTLGVATPVYRAPPKDRQKVVDAADSALITEEGCGRLIADHANSKSGTRGRWRIQDLHPDDSAFLVLPEKVEHYICAMVCKVDVVGNACLIDGLPMYPHRATDIVCACCAEDTAHNYWALFKYKGVMP